MNSWHSSETFMSAPDLRILVLANAKVFQPAIQEPFDHWRIWKARDAIVSAVRKRATDAIMTQNFALRLYLERLEAAETEAAIFEGIYALLGTVDFYRSQLGLHSEYLLVMMSGHLNPWGLLEFQGDLDQPPGSVINAADELWRLAREHNFDVENALKQISDDQLLSALNARQAGKTEPSTGQGN